ncbi:hypothetical protein, partial [Oscillibacter ruminantium]
LASSPLYINTDYTILKQILASFSSCSTLLIVQAPPFKIRKKSGCQIGIRITPQTERLIPKVPGRRLPTNRQRRLEYDVDLFTKRREVEQMHSALFVLLN